MRRPSPGPCLALPWLVLGGLRAALAGPAAEASCPPGQGGAKSSGPSLLQTRAAASQTVPSEPGDEAAEHGVSKSSRPSLLQTRTAASQTVPAEELGDRAAEQRPPTYNISGLCRTFYEGQCGFHTMDVDRFGSDIWRLADAFYVCCLLGGHTPQSCLQFRKETVRASMTGDANQLDDRMFCGELNTLYTAHLLWLEDLHDNGKRLNKTFPSTKYKLGAPGSLACERGHEIRDQRDCTNALRSLMINPHPKRRVQWKHRNKYPAWCSYDPRPGFVRMWFNNHSSTAAKAPGFLRPVCTIKNQSLLALGSERQAITAGGGGEVQAAGAEEDLSELWYTEAREPLPSERARRHSEHMLPALLSVYASVPEIVAKLLGGSATAAALLRHYRTKPGSLVLAQGPRLVVSSALFAIATHLQSCSRSAF